MTRLLPLAALLCTGTAFATNGYFSHGYGIQAKGMGGAATAMANDTMGGANNPASMVFVGSRFDVGLDLFSPKRDAERSGAGFPTLNGKVESNSTLFYVPEAGYNRMLGSDMSIGVTVYGNGGMNTNYPQGNFNCGGGPANMLCGGGELGVDLSAADRRADLRDQADARSMPWAYRCCWATSSSRPTACRPSTTHRASRPSPAHPAA